MNTYKYNYKQIIVLRQDLDMSTGKACAQASHASLCALTDKIHSNPFMYNIAYNEWVNTGHAKIVLGVKNLNKLNKLYDKCKEYNIPYLSHIIDEGRTEFDGLTTTCIAAGPWDSDTLDKIFKRVRLFKS